MMRTGLIGLGYWGPNLARVLSQARQSEFAACCDLDAARRQKIARQYPGVAMFNNVDDLLDSDVEAVLVATPIATHYELARRALLAGKHVFVEKPLSDTSVRARELKIMAPSLGRTLMAEHTFPYSPPAVKINEIIDSGAFREIYYLLFSPLTLEPYCQ